MPNRILAKANQKPRLSTRAKAQRLAAGSIPVIESVVEWGFPFYSPLYRWILTRRSGEGTDGAYGFGRKLLANLLYATFLLNSSKRGDLVLVLARVADHV